ncbi:AEL069Cp [Eremothecium gossypii ATCC 10895]|uniref:AEL069Cp n=1 Tax=Eremothecium gossypii (strain ATCC 10895 / CBS 109.51 / FGSC 9923 / NRRL Y-1056) TaxID=284811 RepID=Q757T1_EREGS|nr:AEL069Cp [Eremothecium gossypii ATCC 10895]AAS52616.2 AEL069Cp [Eremothecium gossypii ATCC 10895]
MPATLALTDVRKPKQFVGGYHWRNDEEILIVEWDGLSIRNMSSPHDIISASSFPLDILSASSYVQPLTKRNYLAVFERDGACRIINEKLEIVDTYTVENPVRSPCCCFDERLSRMFLVWDGYSIYQCELDGEKELFFRNMRAIYASAEEILQIALRWDITDVDGSQLSIGILSKGQYAGPYYYEEIQEPLDQSHATPWAVSTDMLEVGVFSRPPFLLALSSVGSFVLTPSETHYYAAPYLAARTVAKQAKSSATEAGPFPTILDPKLQITNAYVLYGEDSPKICAVTNTGMYFELLSKLAFDSSGAMLSRSPLVLGKNRLEFGPELDYFSPIGKDLILVHSRLNGLVLRRRRDNFRLFSESTRTDSILFAGVAGPEMTSYMFFCGGTSLNNGLLELYRMGFPNEFIRHDPIDFGSSVEKMWPTTEGIYWLDPAGDLHQNSRKVLSKADVQDILPNGQMILRELDTIAVCTLDENIYVRLDSKYELHWSDHSASIKLSVETQPPTRTFMSADSGYLGLSLDNNVYLIDKDKHVQMLRVDAKDPIFSFKVKMTERGVRIMYCDIMGSLVIYKGQKLLAKLKVHSKGLHICPIASSDKVLLYHETSVYLFSLNDLSIGHLPFPCHPREIKLASDDSFLVTDANGHMLVVHCKEMRKWKPQLVRTSDTTPGLISKCVVPTHNPSFIVATLVADHFDRELSKTEYSSQLAVFSCLDGKFTSFYDLYERYPNAIITDIISMNAQRQNDADDLFEQMSYAKKLALSRCVFVSVSYETSEEDGDNIFLYSVDDFTGNLELQMKYNTHFHVSLLETYRDNTILAIGECLQAFVLDYSVKDNRFMLQPLSDAVDVGGVPKDCSVLCIPDARDCKRKRRAESHQAKLVIHNTMKGFQQFEILDRKSKRHSQAHSDRTAVQIFFRPVPIGELDAILKPAAELSAISASAISFEGAGYIPVSAIADVDNTVILIRQDAADVKICQLEIPHRVTSITAARRSPSSGRQPHQPPLFNELDPLFIISTVAGGCYLVSGLSARSPVAVNTRIPGVSIDSDSELQMYPCRPSIFSDPKFIK